LAHRRAIPSYRQWCIPIRGLANPWHSPYSIYWRAENTLFDSEPHLRWSTGFNGTYIDDYIIRMNTLVYGVRRDDLPDIAAQVPHIQSNRSISHQN